jgi:hypothetical protein
VQDATPLRPDRRSAPAALRAPEARRDLEDRHVRKRQAQLKFGTELHYKRLARRPASSDAAKGSTVLNTTHEHPGLGNLNLVPSLVVELVIVAQVLRHGELRDRIVREAFRANQIVRGKEEFTD